MKKKMEQFPEKNPNPVLSVGKNGTILYSNEAGEPLLNEWGVRVGEKLPPYIENIVQRLFSGNSSEKTEVKAENRIHSLSFHPLPEEKCVNIYGFDISDQEEFEEKLRESEKRYHLLFENMLDGYAYCRMLYDDRGHPVDFIYIDTNIAFERLTGLRGANGKRATEAIPGIKEMHPELFDILGRVASTGQPEKFEIDFKPLGMWFSISVYSTEREHFVAVFDNITERKKADDALRQSVETARQRAEELEKLMDMVPAGIWICQDPECRSIIGNRAAGEMYETMSGRDVSAGTTSGKVLNTERRWFKDGRELKPEELPMQVAASKGVEVLDYEMDALLPSGRQITMFGNARPLFDDKGQVRGCIAVYMDITERKRAEEALRESEERYRAFFNTSAVGTAEIDLIGRIINANDCYCQLTGYSYKELIGKNVLELSHPDDRERDRELLAQYLSGKAQKFDVEKRYILKSGRVIWVQATGAMVRDKEGKPLRSIGVVQDITERKQMEDTLRKANDTLEEKVKKRTVELEKAYNSLKESEARLAEAQELAHIGSWERNFASNKFNWSDEMYRILGLKPQEFEMSYSSFLNYVHPDDRDHIDSAVKEALGGNHSEIDFRIITAHGEARIVRAKGEAVFDEQDNPVRIRGTTQDITERKMTEEALRESEERFNLAVKAAQEGVWDWNMETDEVWYSSRYKEMLGYSEDEIEHHVSAWLRLLHPDDKGRSLQLVNAVMRGERNYELEFRLQHKDGHYLNILSRGYPVRRESDGKIVRIVGIHLDLTERKLAEQALLESEKSLAEAQEIAHIGNWERDFAINKLHWSDEMFRIFRLKPQEFKVNYGLFLNYVHPDDRDCIDNSFKGALKGKPINIDFRIVLDNGEERIAHARGGVVFDNNNNPIRIRGTTQDITERTKAEEKIQYLANVVESSTDAIVTVSRDRNIISWNKGAEQIFGYAAEEILGENVSILEPDNLKGDIKQYVEQVKTGKMIKYYESSRLKKDGTIIIISGTLFPVLDTSGKTVAISVIARDITERKRTEETLRNFEIAQKKEIHHRIKNNLQVISSLLDLEAEKLKDRKNISDSEVQTAFKQSMDRVLSIALIHEELYKGKNNELLNFSQYIKELVENLILTYKLESDVGYNFDLEENIFLDMDTAIPLGIIINELITNSFKYAFSGRDKGEIRIKLHREGNGESKIEDVKSTTFILSVIDNGVGIPEYLEIEDLNTLGLQLVTTLVDQLDAELELKRNNGTEFTIRFTVPESNNPR